MFRRFEPDRTDVDAPTRLVRHLHVAVFNRKRRLDKQTILPGIIFRAFNRKLEVPNPIPYVRLESPSGLIWEWNEPSEHDYIQGAAVEFAHVVTQGRNIAEADLEVHGPSATAWMDIAQCFAGPPETPPATGLRGWI